MESSLTRVADRCAFVVLQGGRTALMRAVYFGRTVTAAELVRLGADINATNGVHIRWRTEARP